MWERRWRRAAARCAAVAAALAAAVLRPRLGAPSHAGWVKVEWLRVGALWTVHYEWGARWARSTAPPAAPRLLAICAAHALLVSPALTALLISFVDGVDYRIIKGVMLWCSGGGCAWMSAALSGQPSAASGAALVYVGSLLATPLHTALLCGSAAWPAAREVADALVSSAAPFLAGAVVSRRAGPATDPAPLAPSPRVQLLALALLYSECCERLCDAEAIVYLSDVLVAFALEAWCVGVGCAWSWVWWRAGLVGGAQARLVALVAVPRHAAAAQQLCACAGMCTLPGVFVPPLQALLLTALATLYPDYDDHLH